MPWIIVLGEETAVEWVIANQRMAVNDRVRTLPGPGDRIVLYTSRGAYHNPTRDEAQVRAIGSVTGPVVRDEVTVAGVTYASSFPLTLESIAERRRGLPFAPLVPELEFITKKSSWGGALRRPVVRISDADYHRLERAFRRHQKSRSVSASH